MLNEIKIENLCKSYGNKLVINNFSYTFKDNGIYLIKGISGSGKTTLLNLISMIDLPDYGNVKFNNLDFKTDKERTAFRLNKISYIYQDFNLEENYTVFQNIELPLILKKIKKQNRKQIIENALNKLDLKDIENKKVNKLSGGEKQRVAIARAIVANSEIILADEICSNLDYDNTKKIFNYLNSIKKDKIIIISGHKDLNLIDADFIIDLNNMDKNA